VNVKRETSNVKRQVDGEMNSVAFKLCATAFFCTPLRENQIELIKQALFHAKQNGAKQPH